MPDLNDLLRWSIANTATAQDAPNDQQLSLRFNPTSIPSSGSSALHPSDPLYRTSTDDASPASTPGPVTPVTGTSVLPGLPKRNGMNTKILDIIMGKSDSVTMKEKMDFALDESMQLDLRLEALDDLEMLVELIDNANNMAVLKLWDPLLSLLRSEHLQIARHACWVIGTAVQNNLKAQAALHFHGALPTLLSLIYPSTSSPQANPVRARATYSFSSAVKNWPLATSALLANGSQGYTVLRRGVSDPQPVVRRKMAFLVGTLVLQSDEKYEGELPSEVRTLIEEKMEASGDGESLVDGMKREGVFAALVEAVKNGDGGDFEFQENALRALARAAMRGGLTEGEKAKVKTVWENLGALGQDERGLGAEDGLDIVRAFA